VKLSQSLQNWAGLQGVGKKPRTQKYHREILALILDRWKDDPDVDAITDQNVTDFVLDTTRRRDDFGNFRQEIESSRLDRKLVLKGAPANHKGS